MADLGVLREGKPLTQMSPLLLVFRRSPVALSQVVSLGVSQLLTSLIGNLSTCPPWQHVVSCCHGRGKPGFIAHMCSLFWPLCCQWGLPEIGPNILYFQMVAVSKPSSLPLLVLDFVVLT